MLLLSAIIEREERLAPTLYDNGPAPEEKRNLDGLHYLAVRSQSVRNRVSLQSPPSPRIYCRSWLSRLCAFLDNCFTDNP